MIKSFADGISTRIVWRGCRLLYVIHGVQLRNYDIFKTSALVAVNMGRDAIHIEPFLYQYLGNGKCLLVVSNEGLTELGEASVSTKMFSLPSLDGSTFKKSIHNRSRGLLATSDPCCVCRPV